MTMQEDDIEWVAHALYGCNLDVESEEADAQQLDNIIKIAVSHLFVRKIVEDIKILMQDRFKAVIDSIIPANCLILHKHYAWLWTLIWRIQWMMH
ncbi:unnamed protein product [Anisakis simplex]|uniref:BTB domain-containing protein n=1 Tax=Anisakis simplex TaxID=6269 RepID=A0A0M3J7H2_ANISI|nr:unnamed protein product [Anisakis simplex]